MQGAPSDSSTPGPGLTVVMASPSKDDHHTLRRICRHWKWRAYQAHTCREALSLVRQRRIPVVICERNLPDGDWTSVLGGLKELPHRPQLIVSSRLADHRLWADVLDLGGYDLLISPFDAGEVSRVVFMAWHSMQHERGRSLASPAAAG